MPIERAAPDAVLELASEPSGRVVVLGERNVLRIGPRAKLKGAIEIRGVDSVVEIGEGCEFDGLILIHPGVRGRVRIGPRTTATGANLTLHEDGEIVVGQDCMFSLDVHLEVSDVHPIFDRRSGRRINPAKPIRVGDHVWIGSRVLVMKGAEIGDGAVIGAGSVVRGRIPPGAVASGSPARVVRRDVEWRRELADRIAPAAETAWSWLSPRRPKLLSRGLPSRPGEGRINVDYVGGISAPYEKPSVQVAARTPLVVEGFAFDAARGVLARGVEVVCDHLIIPAVYGDPRRDVAGYENNPALVGCGFRAVVPAGAMRPGRHRLSVNAILADGSAYDASPPLLFDAT